MKQLSYFLLLRFLKMLNSKFGWRSLACRRSETYAASQVLAALVAASLRARLPRRAEAIFACRDIAVELVLLFDSCFKASRVPRERFGAGRCYPLQHLFFARSMVSRSGIAFFLGKFTIG
jgi:hypothetical protein